ncbi:MAG: glycine betaine/L-proline ABC transporter substrate-binding protein ProX [Xenococcaceae cyanobacterium MO_188.B32]|nr:glycine betaine/L-proline ABC transporter substrate-binding protein ProX [Xenococcaceae cyanobacterium MO_188.B32]
MLSIARQFNSRFEIFRSIKKRVQFWVIVCSITLLILLAAQSQVVSQYTNTIKMARPTWETGWFQAEVVKQLLEEIGYEVNEPQTLNNQDFYLGAAQGEVDFWINGWFPLDRSFWQNEEISNNLTTVGTQVKQGAIEGYLIDKKTADKFNIKTIADLEKPEIAEIFDRDNNGKADLIGCNVDWGCAEIIEHHLKAYDLQETVEQVQGNYVDLMRETVTRYQKDKPILFYTWTPNWTLGTFVPKKDVIWLEVPFSSLPEGKKQLANNTKIPDVKGCNSEPCNLGFPPNNIQAVANREFLRANPSIKKLLELVQIPLEDINEQNAVLVSRNYKLEAIQIYASQWIQNNRDLVDLWLAAANDVKLANNRENRASASQVTPVIDKQIITPNLKVVTKRFEPFVNYKNNEYTGFSIDLWDAIARQMNTKYDLYGVDSIEALLQEVESKAADVAIAGITITSQREETVDFSHPYYESGLQILVNNGNKVLSQTMWERIFSVFFRPQLYYGIAIFILILLVAAHVIWLVERKHNPEFPSNYVQGIWESFWWAAVTVTTVGYGDKTPKKIAGKLFGLFWMCAGYFIFAYFTATVTTSFTLEEMQAVINSPQDLPGKQVGTIAGTTAVEYLKEQNIESIQYDTKEEAYLALHDREVDAVVYDAPALQYYASHQGKNKAKVVGSPFKLQNYGIALSIKSPYRKSINSALLTLIEDGIYKQIEEKWFGTQSQSVIR